MIESTDGERRFVDAPEVARTAERAVTLTITAAEVAQLGAARGRGGPHQRRSAAWADCSAAERG